MVDDDQHKRARAVRTIHQASFLRGRGAVAVGVVAALIFPLLGALIGVVLLFAKRPGAGLGCILLSALSGAAYYLVEQHL